nr:hypothetical protein [uncultured Mucilaginibacter sp.]
MAKIIVQPDCGNAPRKLFLKDFNSALANGDIDFITANISEKIDWEIVGQSSVTGKQDYLKALHLHQLWKVKELVIDTIITHGPDASVSGQIIAADKSKFAFCDVYKFKGAGGTIINSIRTFIIKL